MALVFNIGPVDRNPNYAAGEHQYANGVGAGTTSLVDAGGGRVHSVIVGVVGTLLELHDVAAGGSTSATTRIATIDTSVLTTNPIILDVAFSKGLTAITTGAGTNITIALMGVPTVTTRRSFGN